MAALSNAKSDQLYDEDRRRYPIEEHGKFRIQYAYYKNLTGAAGDAGSEIELFKTPPGRVRILPNLSRVRVSAFGASRTLDIGHRAYYSRPQVAQGAVENAEDDDALTPTALDVSAAASLVLGTALKFDVYSVGEITWYATVAGGTIPTDAEIEAAIAYIYE